MYENIIIFPVENGGTCNKAESSLPETESGDDDTLISW